VSSIFRNDCVLHGLDSTRYTKNPSPGNTNATVVDYNLQIYKRTLWKTTQAGKHEMKTHAKLMSILFMPFFMSALQHLGSPGRSVTTNLCHYLLGSSGAKQGTSSAFGYADTPPLNKVKDLTPKGGNKTPKKGNSHSVY